jgi:hypothetical protein
MFPKKKYQSFDELPAHLKTWLRKSGIRELDSFVAEPIPVLKGRTLLEIAAERGGDRKIAAICLSFRPGVPR